MMHMVGHVMTDRCVISRGLVVVMPAVQTSKGKVREEWVICFLEHI